ncbi:Zeta-carotene desaturase /chromoplastic [Citrus sinensis]|nr:Zeta-carotene desaturase /chromoplastic [Citrus sinensis]
MGSSLLFPATSVTGVCWSRVQVKVPRFCVRASLDTNVSDMSVNAPKCLFPPEPEHYRGPKLKVAIIGAGLAGMSTAGELLDQGHEALVDPDGALKDIRDLDSISFSDWFLSKGGTRTSIQRMWDPVAYALGFIDCDNISAWCMLTIFTLFATKTEASLLRMLKGSPDVYLSGPIRKHITDKGGRFHLRWGCREILYDKSANGETYVKGLAMSKATDKKVVQAEAYVTACDVPGIKRLLPSSWREMKFFNNIYELVGVPAVTVQLRYNGWVTELQDLERSRQLRQALGLDDLLYTPHADFSCFADLALTSPEDYYREGQGSLLQCVLTPGDPYMPLPNDEIIRRVAKQVLALFPSSQGLEVIWSSVVKIGQSLYHEGPGKDPFRPDQKTPVKNLFLAGSYTKQDYIDIMEGASLSGRQASAYICNAREELVALRKQLAAFESQEQMEVPTTTNDDLSLV